MIIIHRQSVPLIAIHDPSTYFVRVSEIRETSRDVVPITFYTLSNCSSKDSYIDVEINEIVAVTFGSPTDYGKAVTELYMLGNTTISIDITTEVVPQYSADYCIAYLLVFDDLNNYFSFISSSGANGYYQECIVNEQSQTKNLTFDKPSYYYIGVFRNIPTEATTFSLHFLGTYLQYDISKGNAVCSIDSIDALSCEFSLNTNQPACIVGSVRPADPLFGIKLATIGYYTAGNSDAEIDTFFFTPLMCSIFLVCAVTCFWVIFISCESRGKRQEAQIT